MRGWNKNGVKSFFMAVLFCSLYCLACFHRSAPIAIGSEIARTLNVSESELGAFGSMYFWPYGLSQPIIGLLSDMYPPNIIICVSTAISALGSIGMGVFKSKSLLLMSRAVVGFGCGPVIVPASKIFSRWFSARGFYISQGAILISGSVGGMLSEGPLTSLIKVVSWESVYIGVAVLSFVLAAVTGLFVQNEPPGESEMLLSNESLILVTEATGSPMAQQFKKFADVLGNPRLWALVCWSFCVASSNFNFTSLWGRLFLVSCYGFDHTSAAYYVMLLGVSYIVGIGILSIISETFKTRKKVLVGSSIIGFIISLIFFFYGSKLGKVGVIVALSVFGLVSSSPISTITTMIKEMYDTSLVGTALGCSNFFPCIATTFLQNLVSYLLKFDPGHDPSKPTWEGFRIALWCPFVVMSFIGLVGSFYSLETYPGEK